MNLQLNLLFWLYCRKVNEAPSAELLKTEEWRYGITLLEWVQSKKKLQSTHLLLSPLFSLLNKWVYIWRQILCNMGHVCVI